MDILQSPQIQSIESSLFPMPWFFDNQEDENPSTRLSLSIRSLCLKEVALFFGHFFFYLCSLKIGFGVLKVVDESSDLVYVKLTNNCRKPFRIRIHLPQLRFITSSTPEFVPERKKHNGEKNEIIKGILVLYN